MSEAFGTDPLTSMGRIGIERLSVFDLPPVEFVNLTADLGCRDIGIALVPMGYYNPHGYPSWSLRDDAALRREMLASMRDRGVSISLCEGFGVKPNGDVREYAADLDLVAGLGCCRINVASIDRDVQRSFDQFALLTEMAEPLGIEATTEIGVGPVRNLTAALAAHRHVGRRNFRLLIDTMHFVRHGGSAAEIAALDPDVIGYVQLCDVPLISTFVRYMEEALYERMVPGTGELPLLDILAALPRHLVLGLEVPQRSLAQAGVGPYERVGRCIEATRNLLARITPADSA
jgi:sugar phosphate isomerase/epimerase